MVPLSEALAQFVAYMSSLDRSLETINGYRKDLKLFIRYVEGVHNGVVYMDEVTVAVIQNYMAYLKQERGLAPVSRNRYLHSLRSWFNFAVKRDWVRKNVAAMVEQVKVSPKERAYLTRDELERLFGAIEHPLLKTAVIFIAYTGLRVSEAMNLTLDDVDLDNRRISVRGKGNKHRIVPIADKLHPILVDYLTNVRDADSDRFFATQKTGKLSPQYVNWQLRQACRKLGWNKKVSAHILRHSFATQLVEKNVSLVDLQRLLGHSSLRTTGIYTHTSPERLHAAVNQALND